MITDIQIGKNIAHYRQSAKLSQKELMERVGYSERSSISLIENGKQKVTAVQLVVIADILNVSVEDLLRHESD
jgi:transcriptional regulator with XRE-family HTH domain